MKKIKIILPLFLAVILSSVTRADVLFSDNLDYANGCIETDGLWFAVSASPAKNAFVLNDLLILTNNSAQDSVAAPTNGLGISSSASEVWVSFTINVSKLPTVAGNYFCDLMQTSTNGYSDSADVCHVFCDATGTNVPGTYRLGIANYATSIATAGAANFPEDLATGVTYQVVICFAQNGDPLEGANLWVNPSSENDTIVYASDATGVSAAQNTIYNTVSNISAIEFSPYANAAIGDVKAGTQFSDVDPNPSFAPTFGIEPQSSTNYSANPLTLYAVASGVDVTYQWYDSSGPLSNGGNYSGVNSDALSISSLSASDTYYCQVADAYGNKLNSSNAVITVITTPTAPIFTSVPPSLGTNFVDQTFTLSVAAVGTGPISYQWYFSAAGSGVTNSLGVTTPNYTISLANSNNAGTYYVAASNPAGMSNSPLFSILIDQPPLVPISYLHTFVDPSADANSGTLNSGQLYDVQGVVTTIGNIFYSGVKDPTYTLFFIQDASGGCAVFNEQTATNCPPVGSLVNVVAPIENFYGNLEIEPNAGGIFTVLSTNNPVPAPQLLNFSLMATNAIGAYGSNIEESLVSVTNVYLSTSATTYTPPTGNFPTNSSKLLYLWPSNTSYPGETNLELEVYTYTNPVNQINTNYWGKPIPAYCYEITGIIYIYNPPAELVPSRYQDLVSTRVPPFSATVTVTNGTPTVSWPAVVGSTYSLYSATNLLGPWTQTFGLAYYPSIGDYADTNATTAKFYYISSP